MIPFDKIYSWLFKSFNIAGETDLINQLVRDGYSRIMIVKRSWIFALLMLWMPLIILKLSALSSWIAYSSISIPIIKYTLIGGNILMSAILIYSSILYVWYFRKVYHEAMIVTDVATLTAELQQGDAYFRRFFNWSITNQCILILMIITEIILMIIYQNHLGDHFWTLAFDTLVIGFEFVFLAKFRKKMTDLEMDYNIIVPGKIFFVNQSGVLSAVQTIESDKIKTIQSVFPSKIASFFNFGTIHILTEGDTNAIMGTMSMYYVTNPDGVVSRLHNLLDDDGHTVERVEVVNPQKTVTIHTPPIGTKAHTMDTRGKVRDVLR